MDDVVYGVPQEEQHGLFRNLASQFTKMALREAMGTEIARNVSAFRVIRKRVCVAFSHHYRGSFVSVDVLLDSGHDALRCFAGEARSSSRWCFRIFSGKPISHALANMITGFSVLPLEVASVLGLDIILLGLLLLLYVVGRYLLQGTSVPGFPFSRR